MAQQALLVAVDRAPLGRSPSTISREVQRNGGADRYRAARSDQAAWDRAQRPKICKLACRPFLRRTVSILLQRQWSPEQIAGWLKRTYPGEPQKQVSHETIYRSLFIQARGVLKKELLEHLRASARSADPSTPHETKRTRPDQGCRIHQRATAVG
jgi:IS30 family transposase